MPRLVTKTAKEPMELPPSKQSQWICMCGLSRKQPFCDGSHAKTADEKDDRLYVYDDKGDRRELTEEGGEGCRHQNGDKPGGCCGA